MKLTKTTVAALALATALPLTLAACGGSSSTAASSAAPAASASGSMVGGDPSSWSPVQVTMDDNGKTIDLKVGQFVVINGLPINDAANKINVTSSDEAVAKPYSGNGDSTSSGWQAVGEGTSQIIVMDEDPSGKNEAQPIVQFTTNVTK